MRTVHEEFAQEARRRGFQLSLDESSDRYKIDLPSGWSSLVSLANLEKDVASDGDWSRVSRFMDTVVASLNSSTTYTRDGLLWLLEPNDYVEKAHFRVAVSDEVDRVLVHLLPDRTSLAWVSPSVLETLSLDAETAGRIAMANLDRELTMAKLEFSDTQGVKLGFLNAQEPVKASLILAPGFKRKIEETIGWPVLATAPDRNFLYFWAARHKDFVGRVGRVVVEEFSKASYPLSTEVYSIDDNGLRAIGAFPKNR